MGFVKSYIQRFAYSSVTTEEWKNYLFAYFKDKVRNNWTLRQSYSDWREGTSAWQVLVRGQIVTRKDKYLQGDQAEIPDVIDRWVQRSRWSLEMSFCVSGGHPEQGGLERLDVHTWDASC